MNRSGDISCRTHHITDAETVDYRASIKPHIVYYGTFTGVERNTHAPLLPFNQIAIAYGETRAVGLLYCQRLEVLASTVWQQLGHILAHFAVINDGRNMCPAPQAIILTTGSKLVNAHDLLLLRIHDRYQREGKGVEVGVWVSVPRVASEDESLKESRIAISGVRGAIRPRFDDNLEALWQSELGDLLLE